MKSLYINGKYLGDSFTKDGVKERAEGFGKLTKVQFEGAAGAIRQDYEDYKARQKTYDDAYKEFAQFYIGIRIAGAYTETNSQKQQQAANNKTSTSGEKNTTNKSNTEESGGKNNQTNPQKAGSISGTGSAGSNAKPITNTNATSAQVRSFISTEEQAQSSSKVSSIQKDLNSSNPFVWAQPVYTTVYKGQTYILDGHNRLKAVATNPNTTATRAPIQELSNEKAREMFKTKMEQIEAGKFSKKIGDGN